MTGGMLNMKSIHISRGQAQLLSTFFIIFGCALIVFSSQFILGSAMIGISVWIMMMSESILLAKVEHEMRNAMEELSQQKEKQVEEVLFFLRQSSISASPFKSIDGAKQLCERISAPSMILTTNYQIVKANHAMHNVLGWDCPTLDGVHAYTINDPLMMSKIGSWAAQPKNVSRKTMTSNYVYMHKSGEKIAGLMHTQKIDVQGFFVLFYPMSDQAFSYEEIKEIIVDSKLKI